MALILLNNHCDNPQLFWQGNCMLVTRLPANKLSLTRKSWQKKHNRGRRKLLHFTVCLLAPGPFPDEDGGLGPDPSTHCDSRTKHGKQVDFLHHEAGPVLNGAFWDRLVGLRGNCHVSFAPVENMTRWLFSMSTAPDASPTHCSRMTKVRSHAGSSLFGFLCGWFSLWRSPNSGAGKCIKYV